MAITVSPASRSPPVFKKTTGRTFSLLMPGVVEAVVVTGIAVSPRLSRLLVQLSTPLRSRSLCPGVCQASNQDTAWCLVPGFPPPESGY